MRLTRLDGLVAFVAVAKHSGFTAAAAELGVSAPALSQAIKQLESRLDVRLFNRTTRSVALTEAGREFLARVGPAVDDLFDATESLGWHRDRPRGLLRLNAGRVVASTLLRWVIPTFRQQYPEVTVEVFIDNGMTDIVSAGFDAGFRLGDSVPQDMVALPLGPPMQIAVVASRQYLKGRSLPRALHELRDHELIRHRLPTSGALYKWEFVIDREPVEYETHGGFIVNDSVAMIDAAIDGLGLAYTFDIAVRQDLEHGRLVRCLEAISPRHPGFHIYYAGRRLVPPKLRAFIDFSRRRLNEPSGL